MAQELKQMPLQLQHGHTETHVTITFSQPINNLMLTPAEAEAFLATVSKSRDMLLSHLAKKTKNG